MNTADGMTVEDEGMTVQSPKGRAGLDWVVVFRDMQLYWFQAGSSAEWVALGSGYIFPQHKRSIAQQHTAQCRSYLPPRFPPPLPGQCRAPGYVQAFADLAISVRAGPRPTRRWEGAGCVRGACAHRAVWSGSGSGFSVGSFSASPDSTFTQTRTDRHRETQTHTHPNTLYSQLCN